MKLTGARPSDRIFDAFAYDPETGTLCRPDGTSAVLLRGHKYPRVYFEGRMLYAHRVAWLLAGNGWPELPVDHVNGDLTDIRLCNLRAVTVAQNTWNTRSHGKYAKGVCYDKTARKFLARIMTHGHRTLLGNFETEAEAHAAYCAAAREHHGEFARVE